MKLDINLDIFNENVTIMMEDLAKHKPTLFWNPHTDDTGFSTMNTVHHSIKNNNENRDTRKRRNNIRTTVNHTICFFLIFLYTCN
jgi:hypothetical protein